MLVFPRGKVPRELKATGAADNESQTTARAHAAERDKEVAHIPPQTAIFSWKDVVYDIKIKKEPRRILNHVDGWVKPGTLTALMVCLLQLRSSVELTAGRIWSGQDDAAGCVGNAYDYGRDLGRDSCRWATARCELPAQDGICPATGSALADEHCPRGSYL